MITIRLVKQNGRYIGQSFSDRWNLRVLREDWDLDPNQLKFKEFRTELRSIGFTVISLPKDSEVWMARTDKEHASTKEASLTTMIFTANIA